MSATSSLISLWSSFRFILTLSVLVRIALIVYSEWHDARSIVKYTDVDYRVFSDAAKYILHPGPGNTNTAAGSFRVRAIGDPYTRETYRYTPLLALLLTPNEWLHPSFGKYLFAACDIINGIIIYKLLISVILPRPTHPEHKKPPSSDHTVSQNARQATICSAIHLLNPMVFSISTRGSSESILSLFVLTTLYAALTRRWNIAAVGLGISVHWKIYPFVYGFSCLAVLRKAGGKKVVNGKSQGGGVLGYISSFVNWETLKFGVLSVGTFGILTGGCYLIWGYPFLYETYLYHLNRRDHRHNFSPYFYLTYLTYPSLKSSEGLPSTALPWQTMLHSSLTSFVPQMFLTIGTGFLFGGREDDFPFTWFIQTVVFVVFNKVCTSQYFLWYLLLLPLILPRLNISKTTATIYVAVWVGVQALWLGEAYKLEFLGQNTFYGLWIRGLIYVAGNCWVLGGIMRGYKSDMIS
ncbi:GPI mannosyltransferase 1 [Marasmius crinis-equi]|uniref:GPI mannosyltransferase 1 n=1 Tax=Marasmius crinis-equi TaxID=585013 RepID=A0ABR3FR83_9AGAR